MSIAVESPRLQPETSLLYRISQLWARSEPESAGPRPVCGRPECGLRAKTHFDLYCENVHLLVLGRFLVGQHIVVNALRIAVGALALLAASSSNSIPLYILAAGLFLLFLVLPLRSFRLARALAGVAWVTGFSLAAVTYEGALARSSLGVASLTVAILLLALAVLSVLRDAGVSADPVHAASRDTVAGRLAVGITAGVLVLLLAGLLAIVTGAAQGLVPQELLRPSVLAGLACITGSLLFAASAGLVRGVRNANYEVSPLRRRRGPFPPPQIPPVPIPQRPRFRRGDLLAWTPVVRRQLPG
jgi:hypothetical protein